MLLAKPAIDTKGDRDIVSRLGVVREVDFTIAPDSSVLEHLPAAPHRIIEEHGRDVSCLLVDEAQFLTSDQVDDLLRIALIDDVPVLAYGIRTDFQTVAFPGSRRLLEVAHSLEELKTICRCGRKAIFNARRIDGRLRLRRRPGRDRRRASSPTSRSAASATSKRAAACSTVTPPRSSSLTPLQRRSGGHMAHVLVLGANGFLGSTLTDHLAAQGERVRAFDRFSSGVHFTSTEVEIFQGDFFSMDDIERALTGVEIVYHFVWTTTPASSQSSVLTDVETNVLQSARLLDAASKVGVRRFVFASSGGAIYGAGTRGPVPEATPLEPISPYGIAKLTVEHLMHFYSRTTQMDCLSLRLANPYGPNQRAKNAQGLIPATLDRVLSGEPAVVMGDGSMIRDYIHVDDLVDMIHRVASAEQRDHNTYNLGSGVGTSVREILAELRRQTGVSFSEVSIPQPSVFVQQIVLDTTRYRTEFAERGPRTLSDGLSDTIERRAVGRSSRRASAVSRPADPPTPALDAHTPQAPPTRSPRRRPGQ